MNDKADPIVALAKLLSLFMTAATAEMLAPQLGTVIAGMVGGVFGVMAWRKCTRTEAFAYVFLASIGAWLFASAVAWALIAVWPALAQSPSLYQLCALGVGAVGHRWPAVFSWLVGQGKKRFETTSEEPNK